MMLYCLFTPPENLSHRFAGVNRVVGIQDPPLLRGCSGSAHINNFGEVGSALQQLSDTQGSGDRSNACMTGGRIRQLTSTSALPGRECQSATSPPVK